MTDELPDVWEGYATPENLLVIEEMLAHVMNDKTWTHRFDVPAHINEPNGTHLGPFVRTNVKVKRYDEMFIFGSNEQMSFEGFKNVTSVGFGWYKTKHQEPVYISITPNLVKVKIRGYEIDDENEVRHFGYGYITFSLIE